MPEGDLKPLRIVAMDFGIKRNILRSLKSFGLGPHVVPATTSAEDLLEQFKQGTAHAALVVDEFGTTVGFVSLDDVIDEIIEDDTAERIVRPPDGSMSVAGETTLSDLREELDDPSFEHEDVVVRVRELHEDGDVEPGRAAADADDLHRSSTCRATIMRWISVVPSWIRNARTDR